MLTNTPIQPIEGHLIGTGLNVGIVVSRFNQSITENLLSGSLQALHQHGVSPESVTVAWVPGAFEIPVACQKMAQSGQYDGLIALGCVIRGATPHFDYVCSQAASGIQQVSLDSGLPVSFGVLTTETIEQAVERSGTKAGNKGIDAALSVLETIQVLRQMPVAKQKKVGGTAAKQSA